MRSRILSTTDALLALLRDEAPAPDEQLPRTGVSLEWERLLSSAFVRAPDYGTRCSTVLRIDESRRACFDEWSWDAAGESDRRGEPSVRTGVIPMFKRVLLCYDGTEAGRRALRRGAELAILLGAHVSVLSIVPTASAMRRCWREPPARLVSWMSRRSIVSF